MRFLGLSDYYRKFVKNSAFIRGIKMLVFASNKNPTYYLSTIKLAKMYKVYIDDNEHQFKSQNHTAYDSNKIEQLNAIKEL